MNRNTDTTPGIAGSSLRTDLLEKAHVAATVAAKYASWGEQHARLHDDVVTALGEADIPRLYLPTALQGHAADPVTVAEICEILATADPSAAWYVMVFNAARIMASQWPESLVTAVWGDNPDALVAASGHTPLQGERDGGE